MNLKSDNVKKGPERAPNRSLFYALGYTKEELERPLIGVVSAYSEIVPGHQHLKQLAEAVMAGALRVQLAGDAWYFGKRYKKPTIGDPYRAVEPEDIVRANRLMYLTSFFALAVFGLLRAAVGIIV